MPDTYLTYPGMAGFTVTDSLGLSPNSVAVQNELRPIYVVVTVVTISEIIGVVNIEKLPRTSVSLCSTEQAQGAIIQSKLERG